MKTYTCLNCGKEHKHRGVNFANKYCNNRCQKDYEYREAIKNWSNQSPGISRIKRYLAETFGNKCSICGIDSWNGKDIVLELEHKDGNSQNNSKMNVCLLCPNCHSQTPTYKAKTKAMVDMQDDKDMPKARAFSTKYQKLADVA